MSTLSKSQNLSSRLLPCLSFRYEIHSVAEVSEAHKVKIISTNIRPFNLSL